MPKQPQVRTTWTVSTKESRKISKRSFAKGKKKKEKKRARGK